MVKIKIGLKQLLNDLCSQPLIPPALRQRPVLRGQPLCSPQRQEKFGVPRDLEALNLHLLVAPLCSSVVVLVY